MRLFIAGPYGDHNPKDVIRDNVQRANAVARQLMSEGNQIFCPHTMSWGWEDDPRLSRNDFLELDKSFLTYWAAGVVRIPGESPGADEEVNLAYLLGIPVWMWPDAPAPAE